MSNSLTILGHEIESGSVVLVLFDDYKTAKEEYERAVNGVATTGLDSTYTAVLVDQRLDVPSKAIKIFFRERNRDRVAGFHKRKTVVYNKGRFPQWLREFQNLRTWF